MRRVAGQAEVFAKIGMPPRLFLGEGFAALPDLTGSLNAVDDSRIAGAAAEMAAKSLLYSVAVASTFLPQHRRGSNKNPWNAKTALDSTLEHKRVAQKIPHVFRDALE